MYDILVILLYELTRVPNDFLMLNGVTCKHASCILSTYVQTIVLIYVITIGVHKSLAKFHT